MTRFLTATLATLIVLTGCGTSSHTSAPVARGQIASTSGSLVHFPRDQAAHPGNQNEWWYVVGHLRSGTQRFGYEMTIFRFSHILPPGSPPGSPTSTVYRSDLAITDETGHRFYHRIGYFFPQSAHMSTSSLDVRVGNARLSGSSPQVMTLHFTVPAGNVGLALSSQRPAMDVGGQGYLRFPNGFTYYYSLTNIKSSGQVVVHDRVYQVVGTSWLDHQWGNWTWTVSGGWIWMALQLNNGVQLSVFDVRSSGRHTLAVSILQRDGRLRILRDARFTPLGQWKSPHTGGVYPSGFIVTIPGMKARLRVLPTLKDQEMYLPSQHRGSYWEGSSTITGTWKGGSVSGLAYTELTGYAR